MVGSRGGCAHAWSQAVVQGSRTLPAPHRVYRIKSGKSIPDRCRGRRGGRWFRVSAAAPFDLPANERHPAPPPSSPRTPMRSRYPWWRARGGNAHAWSQSVAEGSRTRSAPHRGYRIKSGKSGDSFNQAILIPNEAEESKPLAIDPRPSRVVKIIRLARQRIRRGLPSCLLPKDPHHHEQQPHRPQAHAF